VQVKEIQIDYSRCLAEAPTGTATPIPDGLVKWSFKSGEVNHASWSKEAINYTYAPKGFKTPVVYNTTQCKLTFNIPEDMTPPVFFYYRLTNFYQNHRRYVKSFQADQLKGIAVDNGTIDNSACDPIRLDPTTKKPYYPCGLIANSLFNDTFYNPVLLNPQGKGAIDNQTYYMTNNSGISWDSDKDLYGMTKYAPSDIIPPPNWQTRYPNNYTDANPPPDLSDDQAFQVWMRTAGLPTFSKLAQRNDTATMEKGDYQLLINLSMSLHFLSFLEPFTHFPQIFPSPNTAAPNRLSYQHVPSWAARTPSSESHMSSWVAFVFSSVPSSQLLISLNQGN
jgi:hypothetical protein